MSIYNPPDEFLTIFNPANYFYTTSRGITQGQADLRYLKKAGDTTTGLINFSSGALFNDGSNTSPISFINDTNTGWYRIANDNFGLACGGVKQVDISTTNTAFTNPIYAPAVSQAYVFSGATQTGMGTTGAGRVAFYSANTLVLQLANSGVNDSRLPIQMFNLGTAAQPQIINNNATTSGIFWKSTPSICFSSGGAERLDLSYTGANFSGQIQGKNGAVNDPSWSWLNEQNSGVYRQASNNIRMSVASSDKFGWSSTTNTSYQNLSMNSNNITSCPKVSNSTGNLTLEMDATTGGLTLTGGALLSGTSGSTSGQHLVITIGTTQYKIELKNP